MRAQSSQPPEFTIYLSGDAVTGSLLLAGALLLTGAGLLPFLLIERQPVMESWQVFAQVLGIIGWAAAVLMALVGSAMLIAAYWDGTKIVLDGDGARLYKAPGKIIAAPWSDGLRVEILTEDRLIKKLDDSPLLMLMGTVGRIIRHATASTEKVTVRYLQIESPTIQWQRDSSTINLTSLERWLRCRVLAEEIQQLGGEVEWDPDGLVQVNLAGTPVDDRKFLVLAETLRTLPQLKRLNLSGTRVTDAILPILESFLNLHEVGAQNTRLSPAKLKQVLSGNAFPAATHGPPTFDFLK